MARGKNIGVSLKAVLFDGEKILTIRRTKTAPSRPLHWDLPGGDLEYGEDLTAGIFREIKEETGLKVSGLKILDAISGPNSNGEFWVTICYTAKVKTTKVSLSFEHDDYKWIVPAEFKKMKASPKNKKFVAKFFQITSN